MAAQVGAVEAELRGHRFVEPVGGAAQLAELGADVVDQPVVLVCHVVASLRVGHSRDVRTADGVSSSGNIPQTNSLTLEISWK